MGDKDKNVVLDADALWWLKEKRALTIMMSMYSKSGNNVVLTPNVIEFTRLWDTYFPNEKEQPATLEQELALSKRVGDSFGMISIDDPVVHPVAHMSDSFFGNAVIVRKGIVDIITDGHQAFYVNTIGSSKRCGGIGDVLAGTIGSFIQFKQGLRTETDDNSPIEEKRLLEALSKFENPLLAICAIACLTVR